MISINFDDAKVEGLNEKLLTVWLSGVCEDEGLSLEEINLIFCSDSRILEINIESLNHDFYTDIITFDYCVDTNVFGDLFISKDRVEENAIDNNVSFDNELYRVIVHGVLHLCGYKDKSDAEAFLMRQKEDFYLSKYVSRETL
jgi:rRNA maturation RNase YbeY